MIAWRDIPAQVIARQGRRRASVQLDDRFQVAIDAAAMRAGLVGTDAYLDEWVQTHRPCGDDLEREAAAEADRLEAAHSPDVLRTLVEAEGRKP